MAVGAGAAVVFVEYDRSPEARYPVAIEQGYATARWITEHGADEGLEASRLAVAGDSASENPAVRALVYVAGFAPDAGETAFQLSEKFEGSTLGAALAAYPVATGGNEFRIADDKFHHQFCADLDAGEAALMAATQRPVTERALTDDLNVGEAPWRVKPSWFVYGERDLNIPAEVVRFMAQRASSRGTREIAGASHAIAVSQPDAVAASIRDAVSG
ncbi:alpha/beta hydrolase [Actinomadura monticuli]|uniref:Alpha/beta hydrolase n=1 Tax=Actinomadura monticuli TaxID=3097367 RepID=A0ABV4QHA2_9ACTN